MRIRVNGRVLSVGAVPQPDARADVTILPPSCGGEIRVETADSYFTADALCAAAFVAARNRGETGRCVVLAESAAANRVIPAVVEPDSGKVTLVLPVPTVNTADSARCCVRFPGLYCFVSTENLPTDLSVEPALHVLRDPKSEMLRIWLYDEKNTVWKELPSSGLAAASAAVDMAASLADGVMEYGIGMPGGTVEVGVSKRSGVLSGISVCSTVSIDRDEVIQ